LEGFEEFWQQYPRKVAKRAAQKAWLKMSHQERQDAIQAVKNHKRYWTIKSTASEFMPHPATWLNQGRWEDELDMTHHEKAVNWWATEKGTAEMADKIGCPARPGEDWNQWKTRISEKLKSA
jgi:hypothetical protein